MRIRNHLTHEFLILLILVFLLSTSLFSISSFLKFRSTYEELNYSRLLTFANNTRVIWSKGNETDLTQFQTEGDIAFIVGNRRIGLIYSSSPNTEDYISSEEKNAFLFETIPRGRESLPQTSFNGLYEGTKGKVYYSLSFEADKYIVVFTNSSYIVEATRSSFFSIGVIYLIVFLLALGIASFWSNKIVKRIYTIKDHVNMMPKNNYNVALTMNENDEITDLLFSIENMRLTIKENEKTKREMLQNVGHDLKTPLAVIKSYAEAIGDGVEDIEATKIIIKQTEVLQSKVVKLLQLNKLEYIDSGKKLEKVVMSDVIYYVTNSYRHKIKENVQVVLDLDDTYFNGFYDNYQTVIENILDNANRYANTIIKVTLKDGVLTIFNDGIPISEKFLNGQFKAYEKGEKGEFGLGMSIVKKTLDYFGLVLTVKNEDKGVSFTISDPNYQK